MGQLLICARVIVELFIKMVISNGKLSLAPIIFVSCLPVPQVTGRYIYASIEIHLSKMTEEKIQYN